MKSSMPSFSFYSQKVSQLRTFLSTSLLLRGLFQTLLLLPSCAPEPLSIGRIQLDLWQPLFEGSLLSNATRTDLVITLDDERIELTFSNTKPQLENQKIESTTVDQVLLDMRSTQPEGLPARTRVGPFSLNNEGAIVTGIFARENTVSRLLEADVQPEGVLRCLDSQKRLHLIGGASPSGMSNTVAYVDIKTQSLRIKDFTLQNRRKDGDCFFKNGSLVVIGGCTATGADVPEVEFSNAASKSILGLGCGTRALLLENGTIAISSGEEFILVDSNFSEFERIPLEKNRYGATLSADNAKIYITGGTVEKTGDIIQGGTSVFYLATATLSEFPNLRFSAGEMQGNYINGHEFIDDDINALVALNDERLLALSDDGTALLLSTASEFDTPKRVSLPEPRQGGSLLLGENNVVYVVGGEAPGVDVFIPDGAQ